MFFFTTTADSPSREHTSWRRFLAATGAAIGMTALAAMPVAAQDDSGGVEAPCESVDFGDVKLKVGGNAYTQTLPIYLPPGLVEIPEARSWDGYPGRENAQQTNEIWELQFLDADGNVIAVSEPSGDVPDNVEEGVWVGSLGTVELTEPAYGVRAHHRPDLQPDVQAGSVYPSAITICAATSVVTPPVETTTTTVPEVTVPPTTEAPCPVDAEGNPVDPEDPDCPTPSGPTTVPADPCPVDGEGNPIDPEDPDCPTPAGPTTAPPTTAAPTTVPAPAGPSTLPVTGSTTSVWLLTSAWLLAAGGTALAWVRHVRPARS